MIVAAAGAAVAQEAIDKVGDYITDRFQSTDSRQKESCDSAREHLARLLAGQTVGPLGNGTTGSILEFMVDRAKNGPDTVRRNCWASVAREYYTRSGQVPPPTWAPIIGWTGSTTTQTTGGAPRQDASPLVPLYPEMTAGYTPPAGGLEKTKPPTGTPSMATQQPAAAAARPWWPWAVGGAVALVGVVLIVRAATK